MNVAAITPFVITPFALAASLLLAAGIGTSVLTAEPPPANVPPAASQSAVPAAAAVDLLDQELSIELNHLDFRAMLTELGGEAGFIPAVVPELDQHPMTLQITQKMKLRDILRTLCASTDTTFVRIGSLIQIDKTDPQLVGLSLEGMPPSKRSELEQRISLDLSDTRLTRALQWIRSQGHLAGSFVYGPSLTRRPEQCLSFRVKDMRVEDVLTWIGEIASIKIVWSASDDRFRVSRGWRPEILKTVPEAIPVPPGLDLALMPEHVRTQLEQRVTIELKKCSVNEALNFVRNLSAVNLLVAPGLGAATREPTVTGAWDDKPLREVLAAICTQAVVRLTYRHGALFAFDPKSLTPAERASPDRTAPNPPSPPKIVDF